MEINLSIWTLLNVALVAVGTYVFLPLFLVLRDFLLWQAIDRFVITEALTSKINLYPKLVTEWNSKFVGNVSVSSGDGKTIYKINEEEVSKESYDEYRKERDHLQGVMNQTIWYIQRRSNLVAWLLRHYKQESDNPIKKMHEAALEREKETNENINR